VIRGEICGYFDGRNPQGVEVRILKAACEYSRIAKNLGVALLTIQVGGEDIGYFA